MVTGLLYVMFSRFLAFLVFQPYMCCIACMSKALKFFDHFFRLACAATLREYQEPFSCIDVFLLYFTFASQKVQWLPLAHLNACGMGSFGFILQVVNALRACDADGTVQFLIPQKATACDSGLGLFRARLHQFLCNVKLHRRRRGRVSCFEGS